MEDLCNRGINIRIKSVEFRMHCSAYLAYRFSFSPSFGKLLSLKASCKPTCSLRFVIPRDMPISR